MEYSVAIPATLSGQCASHLLQHVRQGTMQEDICLALWWPSRGLSRLTALLFQVVLPTNAERALNGNVSLEADFLARGARLAREQGAGLAVMHSHLGPGWQGMSPDDIETENSRSGYVAAATGLPLLGLTIATDEAWSARFWIKSAPKTFQREWCTNVRVVGPQLVSTMHPELGSRFKPGAELVRPASVWGEELQQVISNTHVGIVGLGSVGRMVSEGLARMGVGRVSLMDFDHVKPHNLDRLIGATREDAVASRLKVELAADAYVRSSTVRSPIVRQVVESVVEPKGYLAALDCDVLFSCVDRHWPRRVLNHLAFAHLIPVIDGGIRARFAGNKFRGVEWSLRTAGPGRRCLRCAGAYNPGLIEVERTGLADDPRYLHGLSVDHELRRSENVFSFSMCLAGHELLQFVALMTALRNKPDLGEQRYYYNIAELRSESAECGSDCSFPSLTATGERVYGERTLTGTDPAIER